MKQNKRVRLSKISLVYMALVLFSLTLSSRIAQAEVRSHQISEAVALLKDRDCAGAWRLLWPLAEKGYVPALTLLAEAVIVLGLTPPGQPRHDQDWTSTYIVLALHGYDPNSELAGKEVINYLRSDYVTQPDGSSVADCLENSDSHKTCINRAVNLSIIPNLKAFTDSVNSASTAGALPKCN